MTSEAQRAITFNQFRRYCKLSRQESHGTRYYCGHGHNNGNGCEVRLCPVWKILDGMPRTERRYL